ncbi:MAG: cyclase family protein [Promethearchaeota archaeon]
MGGWHASFEFLSRLLERAAKAGVSPRLVDLSEEVVVGQTGYRPFLATPAELDDGTTKFDVTCTHSHVGTHVEAPLHFFEGGRDVAAYPLEHFVGRALLVRLDASDFPGWLAASELLVGRDFLEERLVGRLSPGGGDVVLFHCTSRLRERAGAAALDGATLAVDAALYLVEAGVKLVGFDALEFEGDGRRVHDVLLSNDVLLVEFLTNLDRLVGDEFLFCCAPVRVRGLDSGWARAWALEVPSPLPD